MDPDSESLIDLLVAALPYVLGVVGVILLVAVLDGRRDKRPPDVD